MRALFLPLLTFLLLLPLTGPALAQSYVEELATTSAGKVVVTTPVDGPQVLTIGGDPVAMPGRPFRLWLEHQTGDRLLFVLADPEDGWCRSLFAWVEAVPGAVSSSEMFGTCAFPQDIGPIPGGGLRVVMSGGEPGAGAVSYDWFGGREVFAKDIGFAPSGQGPDDGPGFWVDRYPYDLAIAADYQDRLIALIGEATLKTLWVNISLSTPFEQIGDWIIGEGCEKFTCPANAALIALHAQDGRMLIALRENGRARLFGGDGVALPAPIAAFLAPR